MQWSYTSGHGHLNKVAVITIQYLPSRRVYRLYVIRGLVIVSTPQLTRLAFVLHDFEGFVNITSPVLIPLTYHYFLRINTINYHHFLQINTNSLPLFFP